MTISIYRSTDVGAPVFSSGVKGSLITVLDACLVNGYGSKSPLGWSKVYSGTRPTVAVDPWAGGQPSAAVYQQPAGTAGTYMYITDLKYMFYVQGFETISSTDPATATGAFPRTTMLSDTTNHCGWAGWKCDNSTTVNMSWELFSDGKTIIFTYLPISGTYWNTIHSGKDRASFIFGDIKSYKSGDPYRAVCIGHGNNTAGHSISNAYAPNQGSTAGYRAFDTLRGFDIPSTAGLYPIAIQRTMDGTTNSSARLYPLFNHNFLNSNATTYGIGCGGAFGYPNQADGGVYIDKIRLHEYSSALTQHYIRGEVPGLYMFCHIPGPLDVGTQFNGTGDFAGKTFEIVGWHGYYNSGYAFNCVVIDVTPTTTWS